METKTRIVMAKEAFIKKKSTICSTVNLEIRKRLVTSYVWRILSYSYETWTTRNREMDRKMENNRDNKMGYKCENEDILIRVKENRALLDIILNRIGNWDKTCYQRKRNNDYC